MKNTDKVTMTIGQIKKLVKEARYGTFKNAGAILLDLAEEDMISWETIARECIAEMSRDELESVCDALEIEY